MSEHADDCLYCRTGEPMEHPYQPPTDEPLDVWLRFASPDNEEAEAEANVFPDGDTFRADWYLTAVGLVKSHPFATYAEAHAWLEGEGFQDFTA